MKSTSVTKKQVSVGLIPFYKDKNSGEYRYLVAKPGGSFWVGSKSVGFIKGLQEEGESLAETCIREFCEETGLESSDPFIETASLEISHQEPLYVKSKKDLYFYLIETEEPLDNSKFFSNTFWNEKTQQEEPENDEYLYLTLGELRGRLFRSQLKTLERLSEMHAQ